MFRRKASLEFTQITIFVMLLMLCMSSSLSKQNRSSETPVKIYSQILNEERTLKIPHKIINTYPHPPDSFTQGLAFYKGFLYEGTGKYGHSSLRKINLETGEILEEHQLPSGIFGEGITIFQDKIIQLTWYYR